MSANPSTSRDHPLILAIDDDALDRALIEHVLSKNGYTVQTAETAEIALQIMKKTVPALLIVDVSLPGMSGYDLCSNLKANPKLKNIPIVFLSGRDSPSDFKTGRDVGGVFYIPKSSSTEHLLTAVRMLYGVRHSRPLPVPDASQTPELGAKQAGGPDTEDHQFDIFEKSPDGTIRWRGVVSALEPAIVQMKALAKKSGNEFVLFDSVTNKIVERANASPSFLAKA